MYSYWPVYRGHRFAIHNRRRGSLSWGSGTVGGRGDAIRGKALFGKFESLEEVSAVNMVHFDCLYVCACAYVCKCVRV